MKRVCKNITDEILEQNKDIFGILYIQTILAGKWKIAILWFLKDKAQRYNEIRKFLKTVSQAALTKQLRELESDKIVNRKIYNEIPPKVEYSLTERGKKLIYILSEMKDIGVFLLDKDKKETVANK